MKRLHVVPELNEANGVYQVARDLAREDGGELIGCSDCSIVRLRTGGYDEVWVHGMWLPKEWRACRLALQAGNRLVRMTHGSLSPVYLERQGKWKKRLVGPIERWLFAKTDRVVVTCAAERTWCVRWGLKNAFEIVDLKRFFRLGGAQAGSGAPRTSRSTRVLYLGRRHPLKGVGFLERAVQEINDEVRMMNGGRRKVELRVVSDHFGEELEKDWEWCDVLCLPTLSENFGRVVAEALERGKRVVTTDGAPAWAPGKDESKGEVEPWRDRLIYLQGYRNGTDGERVKLLKDALSSQEVFP